MSSQPKIPRRSRRDPEVRWWDEGHRKDELNDQFLKAFLQRWESGSDWLGHPWRHPSTRQVVDRKAWCNPESEEYKRLKEFDFARFLIGRLTLELKHKHPDISSPDDFREILAILLNKFLGLETSRIREYALSHGFSLEEFLLLTPEELDRINLQRKAQGRELVAIKINLDLIPKPQSGVHDYIDQWRPDLEVKQWASLTGRNLQFEVQKQVAKIRERRFVEGTSLGAGSDNTEDQIPGVFDEERLLTAPKRSIPLPKAGIEIEEIEKQLVSLKPSDPQYRALQTRLAQVKRDLMVRKYDQMKVADQGLDVEDAGAGTYRSSYGRRIREPLSKKEIRSLHHFLKHEVRGFRGEGAPAKARSWPLPFQGHPVSKFRLKMGAQGPGLYTLLDLWTFLFNDKALSHLDRRVKKLPASSERARSGARGRRAEKIDYLAHYTGVSEGQIQKLITYDLYPQLERWAIETKNAEAFEVISEMVGTTYHAEEVNRRLKAKADALESEWTEDMRKRGSKGTGK